eukprot:6692963-Pyramimonas_sp.AAC.1
MARGVRSGAVLVAPPGWPSANPRESCRGRTVHVCAMSSERYAQPLAPPTRPKTAARGTEKSPRSPARP